jgi:hypothetical protein
VRLEGSLDAFSLPDIFSLLSMTKKTGGLHLRRPEAHGVVWLADGLITGGASDVSRLALGRRIAGSPYVADDQLESALETVRQNPDLGLASALRDARAIDEGDLHAIVSEHVVDTVFDLMRWPNGEFGFVLDEPNVDDVGVARPVDDVVAEARLRLDAWSAFDERVVVADTVLSLALDPGGDPTLVRDEWALMALVDGRRTVGDLVELYGRGEYAVVVALAELVRRGLIRPDDNAGTSALEHRRDLIASLESGRPAPDPSSAGSTDAQADSDAESTSLVEPASTPDPALEAVPDETEAEAEVEVLAEASGPDSEPFDAIDALDDDDDDDSAVLSDLDVDVAMEEPAAEAPIIRQRSSEPFTTAQQPERVEALAASGGSVLTTAAPMSAGTIERDPSVNKSLLLRLIAGVRGL